MMFSDMQNKSQNDTLDILQGDHVQDDSAIPFGKSITEVIREEIQKEESEDSLNLSDIEASSPDVGFG